MRSRRKLKRSEKSPAKTKIFQIEEATIADVHRAFRAKKLTATQLVHLYLKRIKAYNGICVDGALDPATGLHFGDITPIANAPRPHRSSFLVMVDRLPPLSGRSEIRPAGVCFWGGCGSGRGAGVRARSAVLAPFVRLGGTIEATREG